MRKKALLLAGIFTGFCAQAQDSVSVLFIGNSYTQANDLPQLTRQLAGSLGKELTVGTKANGGFTFQNHCNDAQTFTAMHQQNWDVVVLQGQSQEPSFPDAQVDQNTLPFAVRLADSAYAINPCSNVLFYMTWGRENGDPQWAPISTFDGMNERLYNAYMRMADSAEAMVAAVGASWKYVRDHHPAIQLYSGDGSHPSVAGSYLAACTFYVSLFREPVSGAPYTAGLDAATASQLQAAADAVVLDSLEHFKLHAIDEPVQAQPAFTENGLEVQFTNLSTREEEVTWFFGDGSSSTDSDPVHTYTVAGPYEVMLVAANACTSDTAFVTVLEGPAGLNDLPASDIHISDDGLTLTITAIAKPIYYEIHTIDGKKILSGKILTSDSQGIRKPQGVSVITLRNEQGGVFQLKIFANS